MKKYKIDYFSEDDVLSLSAELGDNPVIVETAGFVPLDVKLKRFEQSGQLMQFQTSEFTANDYRELYMNPDFDITPDDDYEDVQEKLEGLKQYQAEVIAKIKQRNNPENSPASPEKETAVKNVKEAAEE